MNLRELLGECIGTFILVFFGCGTVAGAVLFNSFDSLFEVAALWGFAVTIAIFVAGNFGDAHLNPAVSWAMFLMRKLTFRKWVTYSLAQLLGALVAGGLLLVVINENIHHFETLNDIVRGEPASYKSAVMFGDFFPNPSFAAGNIVGWPKAMLLEAFGVFVLLLVIFTVTHTTFKSKDLAPLWIGLTITLLITFIAPYTQAGFNPARDFGPRLIAYFGGWGDAAFPLPSGSFFTVYILGPFLGASAAAGVMRMRKVVG